MNQENLNKNITGTQVEDVLKCTMQQDKNRFLSYKFEIVDDENIYSISFEGNLTEEETQAMLESMQNCLYENIADAIQRYLKQNNLICSGFVSTKKPLEHTMAMELAELLLDSDICGSLSRHIGDTDIFYAIADHQKWTSENCCHGCYFAVKRTLSEAKSLCKYNIIGQTFNYNQITDDESAYFAIRENRDSELLYNNAESNSEPVLPTFGCVDMMNILLDIDNIKTAEQVIQIAVK